MTEPDSGINDPIDAAYRVKYERYSRYVAPMVAAKARSTTIKLMPRSTGKWKPIRATGLNDSASEIPN